MKSFKELWKQAIEDTTTMNVDLTPTLPKKKKKNEDYADDLETGDFGFAYQPTKKRREKRLAQYDGRTKEGKKFVERILAKRQAREAKKAEK